MAWLDETQIRDKFNIQSKAYSSQIGSASDSAARKIRRWIDAATYTDAIDDTAPVDAEDLLRYETVVDAHAFLTMYYLSMSVGSKLSPDGFIKSAQSSSSPVQTQTVTNNYLTPAEMAAKKQEYYDAAWDIIEPYAVVAVSEAASTTPVYPTAVSVVADW